jgi:hypothetical protein
MVPLHTRPHAPPTVSGSVKLTASKRQRLISGTSVGTLQTCAAEGLLGGRARDRGSEKDGACEHDDVRKKAACEEDRPVLSTSLESWYLYQIACWDTFIFRV